MFRTRRAAEWRHDYANLALGGGNLAILLLGFQLGSALGWTITLALVGLTSFWAWHANLKRYRTMADTPTSRIVSAPQGYIELVGRGHQPPGDRLISPINGLPCLWYRYRIERKHGDRWEYVESGVSHDTFGVSDGSGQVLVDPDGAEILTSHKQVSSAGGFASSPNAPTSTSFPIRVGSESAGRFPPGTTCRRSCSLGITVIRRITPWALVRCSRESCATTARSTPNLKNCCPMPAA